MKSRDHTTWISHWESSRMKQWMRRIPLPNPIEREKEKLQTDMEEDIYYKLTVTFAPISR